MDHRFGFVALMGPPNAGKSTLMNAYLGQKVAIVTPKPQTTRNRISGILSREDAQVVFMDTPGVHRLKGRMNRFLLDSAFGALSSCDMAVVILDAALYAKKPHLLAKEMQPLLEPVRGCGLPLLVAVNKVDSVKDKTHLLPLLEQVAKLFEGCDIFPISARRKQGLDKLMDAILSRLPEGPPMFPEDQLSTVPLRFMASEIVREKLFLSLRQELPYQTAVEIEQFEEGGPSTHIGAVIYVGKASHKGMVIGKGGANLKKIGASARKELEELVDTKVMLQLWVKVREGWTEHPGFLRSIGIGE